MTENEAPFLKMLRARYRRYSKHVLGFRHFAEGRDGLKPVHRRTVWAMHGLGAHSRKSMTKTSRASGEAMGRYHPHNSETIESAIADMSQAKSPAPMIVGVGNFGSHDARPAAPRYTSCFLSPYAQAFLDTDELSQVPMDQTYDGKGVEPRYLPAPLPHLLAVGCSSIAPGISGNIPPCDPDWILEAVAAVLKGRPSDITKPTRFAYRWGGRLLALDDSWLTTGVGGATFRPTLRLEKRALIVTCLAPNLKLLPVEAKLARCPAFGGMAEESVVGTSEILRAVASVRRGHDPRELGRFAAHALCVKTSFSFLHIAQRDGEDGDVDFSPVVEGPLAFLVRWVSWRKKIVAGAAKSRAESLTRDIARIDLLIRAIAKADDLIAALRSSKTREAFHAAIKKILCCSDAEAQVIRETQLQRLAFLEVAALRKKRVELAHKVRENEAIVVSPGARLSSDAERAVSLLRETLSTRDLLEAAPAARRRRRARTS